MNKEQQHRRRRALAYLLGSHGYQHRGRMVCFGEVLRRVLRRYPASARTDGFIEDAWRVWSREDEFCKYHTGRASQ